MAVVSLRSDYSRHVCAPYLGVRHFGLSIMSFKTLSSITSVVAFILFANFLVFPDLLFYIFGVEGSDSAYFIGKRLSVLFFGMSILTWFSRNAEHSEARQAISLSISISMFAMAFLGLFEYFRGFAGIGILIAVITEMLIGYLYFKKWNSGKNA
ncbi:hypothetical protein [Alteromonas confluentis]|uniref:Uncharacterized protein n=4 Tax=Alteromonas confluentis TaxID=1656094 RepID=A0A1E7ZDT8_9ALTE|nr:hypothetical protein [Alteromonas confluentis]OFC71675.1 hypothetical protein BFC18_06965 [Alteromonas confluentis]